MRNRFFLLVIVLFVSVRAMAQAGTPAAAQGRIPRPKLVVGITVDQMRWDYLYRYADRYGENGFRRLLREGFSCENTFIPYTPTYTAAGHAGIYTGSVPALHGIIGNNWFERSLGKDVYCTDDSTVRGVGTTSDAGKMSPRNMWASTIGDELRLSANFRSKVVGVALKDRASILPAGHIANAAYWFDNATGGFISSTFYMQDLPLWVRQFNARKFPDEALKKNWETLYPLASYRQSTNDEMPYENNLPGGGNKFPHVTASVSQDRYQTFRYTPFANTFTFEMAKAAVEGEKLGKGNETDLLAVSFSSTDYIGHEFGPNSIEVEDTYLRFDKDLGDFLQYLDRNIGKGNYLLFLSADHGAAHVPAMLQQRKFPAGFIDDQSLRSLVNEAVSRQFDIQNIVLQVINYQLYLDHQKMRMSGKDEHAINSYIIAQLMQRNEIANAFLIRDAAGNLPLPQKVTERIVNGYNQKRSGDIQFVFKPGYFDGGSKGTTHGTWNPHDAHIPLLWFGWHVRQGKTNRETYMADIAPTVTALLEIQMPNACIGNVIPEVTQ